MPLGLIAGNGKFPFLILRAARQLGHEVVVVGVEGEAFPTLEDLGLTLRTVSNGSLSLESSSNLIGDSVAAALVAKGLGLEPVP